MKIEKHLGLLGMRAVDKITGQKGVIGSISFDLYGCIQGLVTPAIGNDGKQGDSLWFDLCRLKITSKKPVMPLPKFDSVYLVDGNKGPAMKPTFK